jgi:hypothetical protein
MISARIVKTILADIILSKENVDIYSQRQVKNATYSVLS